MLGRAGLFRFLMTIRHIGEPARTELRVLVLGRAGLFRFLMTIKYIGEPARTELRVGNEQLSFYLFPLPLYPYLQLNMLNMKE